MTGRICAVFLSLAAVLTSGCSAHRVSYKEGIRNMIPPAERATAIEGNIDEAKHLHEQAMLPHNTPRERYELERQAGRSLRFQLGSQDYVTIGEVYGGGNARTNIETLKEALCKKAASHGGDVVLVFRAGIEDRGYAYSTPGYSTTNMQGSAYRYGNMAYGNATANTTYVPGQTYTGVLHLPYANGLVFKHVPGVEARRERMATLDDATLERILNRLEEMDKDPNLTFEENFREWDRLMDEARPGGHSKPAASEPAEKSS